MRSPTMRNEFSCRYSTGAYSSMCTRRPRLRVARSPARRPSSDLRERRDVLPASCRSIRRRPRRRAPRRSGAPRRPSASGCSGNEVLPSTSSGRPALGTTRDRAIPVLREPLDVLGHLDRTRRAVQSERRDRIAAERRRRRGDLRAEQHGAGRLDRDADHDRDVAAASCRARRGPSRHALTAHLICRRSWQVSIRNASAPPSIRPRACSA